MKAAKEDAAFLTRRIPWHWEYVCVRIQRSVPRRDISRFFPWCEERHCWGLQGLFMWFWHNSVTFQKVRGPGADGGLPLIHHGSGLPGWSPHPGSGPCYCPSCLLPMAFPSSARDTGAGFTRWMASLPCLELSSHHGLGAKIETPCLGHAVTPASNSRQQPEAPEPTASVTSECAARCTQSWFAALRKWRGFSCRLLRMPPLFHLLLNTRPTLLSNDDII